MVIFVLYSSTSRTSFLFSDEFLVSESTYIWLAFLISILFTTLGYFTLTPISVFGSESSSRFTISFAFYSTSLFYMIELIKFLVYNSYFFFSVAFYSYFA